MRNHPPIAALVASACTFILASPLRAEQAPPEMQAEFVEATAPEASSYRSTGSYAIDRLVYTMITDSARAVAGGTEVAALPTCHLKDVPMKNGTVAGLPRITEMKLTSLKLRNPANAPDAAEQAALKKVRYLLEAGMPPQILVQRVKHPSGKQEWRVYKPLAYIRQCGTCHARPDEQSPELRAALQEKYAKDESSSYGTNEWRGLIRVTVADPAAPAGKAAVPAKATAPAKGTKRGGKA